MHKPFDVNLARVQRTSYKIFPHHNGHGRPRKGRWDVLDSATMLANSEDVQVKYEGVRRMCLETSSTSKKGGCRKI